MWAWGKVRERESESERERAHLTRLELSRGRITDYSDCLLVLTVLRAPILSTAESAVGVGGQCTLSASSVASGASPIAPGASAPSPSLSLSPAPLSLLHVLRESECECERK